jgi:predicted O-methyltransferase YrrM
VQISALATPTLDPTPIFEIFRGSCGTELLTAAVAHFDVFSHFRDGPLSVDAARNRLGLAERPAVVLFTALRAFELLLDASDGRLELSQLAREHLLPGGPFDVSDYIGLAAENPGVKEMVERLRTNRPAGASSPDRGAAFIYREGIESARHLPRALAGRAKNVAPLLAGCAGLQSARLLLDVGGGTGLYAIACLQRYPKLRVVVWDRPEVLKVAAEMADRYGVADRLECRPGDMFTDAVPTGIDAVLLSNVLHDWDVPQCMELVRRCADALPPGGQLLIHDVFLNDALDGPLPVALYSAALFCLTEGRAYSGAEYRDWLQAAGLVPGKITPTLIHCGMLPAVKQ